MYVDNAVVTNDATASPVLRNYLGMYVCTDPSTSWYEVEYSAAGGVADWRAFFNLEDSRLIPRIPRYLGM